MNLLSGFIFNEPEFFLYRSKFHVFWLKVNTCLGLQEKLNDINVSGVIVYKYNYKL